MTNIIPQGYRDFFIYLQQQNKSNIQQVNELVDLMFQYEKTEDVIKGQFPRINLNYEEEKER